MRIATYNVNGISARLPRLLEWLAGTRPDVACLQEIKIDTERFPVEAIRDAGYHALVHGQKGFNGVAILSRIETVGEGEEVGRGLAGDDEDVQSRFIEARVRDCHVSCLYLPNGNPAPGPKYDYKLSWMERLRVHGEALLKTQAPVVLAGDWNVCPTDMDVARPDMMASDALCLPETRAAWRTIMAQGWTEAIRACYPHAEVYTFWDYQAGAWPKNWGLRIDHLLLSPAAADRLVSSGIDREMRGAERASDHVAAWVELAD